MRISSAVTEGLFASHSNFSSILKLMKNRRTIFPAGGLNVHEQLSFGGYVNGQLGVKKIPSDDPRSSVLLQIKRKAKLINHEGV